MITTAELDRMSHIKPDEADKATLIDIQTIEIDPLLSAAQRMEYYLEQVRNPYLFLCGDTAVRVRFEAEKKPLACKLKNFLISIKKD